MWLVNLFETLLNKDLLPTIKIIKYHVLINSVKFLAKKRWIKITELISMWYLGISLVGEIVCLVVKLLLEHGNSATWQLIREQEKY